MKRRPAQQADQRIGSLLVNPGGPGLAGTDLVEQAGFYFSEELRDRFDIVAFDPRGTGRSSPVDCVDDLDPVLIGTDPTPETPEEVQQLADQDAAFTAGCVARSQALLPYLSTEATARDIDSLRRALGESEISYFGFSYGSELGATWATRFPETVRAAVLDGAANPNAGWEADRTAQAVGLERGFLAAMQSCAGDPSCPFYNDGNPVAAYEALSATLDSSPVVGDRSRLPANQSVLFYATASRLRDSTGWDELYQALADAQDGDVRRLFELYDGYVRRSSDGSFANVIEAHIAIDCLEYPGPTDPSQFPAHRCPHPPGGAPHGHGLRLPVRLRGMAGSPARRRPGSPRRAPDRVLVVGTSGDTITPIESSRAWPSRWRTGCCSPSTASGTPATDSTSAQRDVVDRYLVDLAVPADGTVCA